MSQYFTNIIILPRFSEVYNCSSGEENVWTVFESRRFSDGEDIGAIWETLPRFRKWVLYFLYRYAEDLSSLDYAHWQVVMCLFLG